MAKIKDTRLQATALKAVGNIMYDIDRPKDNTMKVIQDLSILKYAKFYECFQRKWASKIAMWVEGHRKVPHAWLDTNVAFVRYHSF